MRLRPILIVTVILFVPVVLSAEKLPETTSTSTSCFVDLDGDGIDDNVKDLDGNGIPDFDIPEEASSIPSGGSGIFASMTMNTGTIEVARVAENFGGREFGSRWLCVNRGGITSGDGFGPGAGIGSGSLGKVCIGGVCF